MKTYKVIYKANGKCPICHNWVADMGIAYRGFATFQVLDTPKGPDRGLYLYKENNLLGKWHIRDVLKKEKCKKYLDKQIKWPWWKKAASYLRHMFFTRWSLACWDLRNVRQGKCNGCPRRKREDNTCGICSCQISEKVKYKKEKCPLGKWS